MTFHRKISISEGLELSLTRLVIKGWLRWFLLIINCKMVCVMVSIHFLFVHFLWESSNIAVTYNLVASSSRTNIRFSGLFLFPLALFRQESREEEVQEHWSAEVCVSKNRLHNIYISRVSLGAVGGGIENDGLNKTHMDAAESISSHLCG